MLEGYDFAWGGNDQLFLFIAFGSLEGADGLSPPVARDEKNLETPSYPTPVRKKIAISGAAFSGTIYIWGRRNK